MVNLDQRLREVFALCRLDGLLHPKVDRPPQHVIRALAHRMWDEAGRPGGNDTEFWYSAERELNLGV